MFRGTTIQPSPSPPQSSVGSRFQLYLSPSHIVDTMFKTTSLLSGAWSWDFSVTFTRYFWPHPLTFSIYFIVAPSWSCLCFPPFVNMCVCVSPRITFEYIDRFQKKILHPYLIQNKCSSYKLDPPQFGNPRNNSLPPNNLIHS